MHEKVEKKDLKVRKSVERTIFHERPPESTI